MCISYKLFIIVVNNHLIEGEGIEGDQEILQYHDDLTIVEVVILLHEVIMRDNKLL
jgi:hypothetical protein